MKLIKMALSFIKYVIAGIAGSVDFLRLVRKSRKENTHYLVVHYSMGDALCALAYLDAYASKNGYESITAIACESVRQICSFYSSSLKDVIFWSKKRLRCLEIFSLTVVGRHLCAFYYRNRITFTYYRSFMTGRSVYGNEWISIKQLFRDFIYQLGPDAEIKYPDIPKENTEALISEYGIRRGQTVFLNPYANSVICDVSGLFSKLADRLEQYGYRVITVTANDEQEAVPGTSALRCSLAEAFHLAEYGGCVIGLRSGFLDLMAFADCSIISIINSDHLLKGFFELEKWELNSRCRTIEYDHDDERVLREIMEYLTV